MILLRLLQGAGWLAYWSIKGMFMVMWYLFTFVFYVVKWIAIGTAYACFATYVFVLSLVASRKAVES